MCEVEGKACAGRHRFKIIRAAREISPVLAETLNPALQREALLHVLVNVGLKSRCQISHDYKGKCLRPPQN